MTPQVKAKLLFDKYDDYPLTHWWKKQCALIAVDEILKIISLINDGCGEETTLDYWQQVKTEIEQL